MNELFEDIRIVDLDLKRTTWSRVHGSMRVMYLRLDREPDDMRWARLFHEERQSRVGLRRRGLWLEGEYISFDCLPSDVEEFHLPDIRKSIEFANREFRALFQREWTERNAWRADTRTETEAFEQLQSRVRQLIGAPPSPVILPTEAPPPAPALAASSDSATQFNVALHAELLAMPTQGPVEQVPDAVAIDSPAETPTLTEPAVTTAAPADAVDEEFEAKRRGLRERFRAALTAHNEESKRGQR